MQKSNIHNRHPYANRMRKWRTTFFQIGLILSLGLVTLAFNWTSVPQVAAVLDITEITPEPEFDIIRTKHPEKKVPPPTVVQPSTEVIAQDLEFNPDPVPDVVPQKIILKNPVAPRPPVPLITAPVAKPPAPLPDVAEPAVEPIWDAAEEMPRFRGCESLEGTKAEKKSCADKKLLAFIYDKIHYPQLAKSIGIEGVVVIQFVIEKDGSISDIEIAKDIGGGCGLAAEAVVKQMPRWIPGKQRGKPVRVRYRLPVRYRLK